MGKFDGVLLAVDYDDTLMPFGHQALSEANRSAIAAFCAAGGRFTLATGRDLRSYQSICDRVKVNAPVVLSNGALIFDPVTARILFQSALPNTFRRDLQQLLDRFPELGVEVHRDFDIYVVRDNAGVQAHLQNMGGVGIPADFDTLPPVCTKAAIIAPVCYAETPLSRAVADYCSAAWGDRYEMALSHGILDLACHGVHKGSGVAHLRQILDIAPEHCYCAGDNWNDLPMLRACAQGFVPASARRELRSTAGLCVVSACDQDAVADVIDHLNRRYP